MKKLLCLLLALGFFFSIVGNVRGDDEEGINPSSERVKIKTYVFVKDSSNDVNASATGDTPQAKAVPLANINTNDRIVGLTLTANTPSNGAVCSIYDVSFTTPTYDTSEDDAAERAMTNSNLIVEVEVGADPGSTTLWFPYPKKISNRLCILIGEAHAAVTVYYVDVSDIR